MKKLIISAGFVIGLLGMGIGLANAQTQEPDPSGSPTPASPPTVTLQAASPVGETSVTLNGTVTATGGENPAVRGFYYGLTTSYGLLSFTNGTYGTGVFSQSVTGLTCNTAYHFRAFATNSGGVGTSADSIFQTIACTSPTPTPSTSPTADVSAPSVPGNPTATKISSSQISLSWTASVDNVGVSGYKIFRNGTQIGTTAVASYLDSGLSTGTVYTYTVKAYDASGNASIASAGVSISIAAPSTGGGPIFVGGTGSGSQTTSRPILVTLNLSFGLHHGEILIMQKILNGNGYPVAAYGPGSLGNETDYFGPATRAAIQRFQCAKGIVCSGTPSTTGYGAIDARTRLALNALPNLPVAAVQNNSAPVFSNSVFTRALRVGSTGDDVRRLQIYLNSHGFVVATFGSGSPGNETTYFGPATMRAVVRFQEAHASTILAPNGLTSGTGYFGPSSMRVANGQ